MRLSAVALKVRCGFTRREPRCRRSCRRFRHAGTSPHTRRHVPYSRWPGVPGLCIQTRIVKFRCDQLRPRPRPFLRLFGAFGAGAGAGDDTLRLLPRPFGPGTGAGAGSLSPSTAPIGTLVWPLSPEPKPSSRSLASYARGGRVGVQPGSVRMAIGW